MKALNKFFFYFKFGATHLAMKFATWRNNVKINNEERKTAEKEKLKSNWEELKSCFKF